LPIAPILLKQNFTATVFESRSEAYAAIGDDDFAKYCNARRRHSAAFNVHLKAIIRRW